MTKTQEGNEAGNFVVKGYPGEAEGKIKQIQKAGVKVIVL
jgi:hypothetical protein